MEEARGWFRTGRSVPGSGCEERRAGTRRPHRPARRRSARQGDGPARGTFSVDSRASFGANSNPENPAPPHPRCSEAMAPSEMAISGVGRGIGSCDCRRCVGDISHAPKSATESAYGEGGSRASTTGASGRRRNCTRSASGKCRRFRDRSSSVSTTSPIPNPSAGRSTPPIVDSRSS